MRNRGITQNRKPRPPITVALAAMLGIVSTNVWAQGHASVSDNPSATTQAAKHQDTWVPIIAFIDIPLGEADVEVYDIDGRRLFKRNKATNAQGVFAAKVKDLPRDFRVTVTWDGDQKKRSNQWLLGRLTLSSDVQNFNPVDGIVHVNAVTTIVSRLVDRSPRLNIQEQQALVRQYLGLQVNSSLGAALRQGTYFRSRHFSHTAFLAEAAKYGGMEPFLNFLVTEMLARPGNTQLFVGAPQGIAGTAASFVAKGLASGALSWAGGKGMGWAMQSAGLSSPGATAADIANLQTSLSDLQSSVDDLKDDIANLQSQLSLEIANAGYQTIVASAQDLQARVDSAASRLSFYALGCPPVPEGQTPDKPDEWCVQNKPLILDQLNLLSTSFEALSSQVLDNSVTNFKGLIHMYSQLMGQSLLFFRPADSTKLQANFDYWDASLVQAATLKTELFHFLGNQNNPGGIAEIQDFLGNANANPPTQGKLQTTRDREGPTNVLPPCRRAR